MPTSQVVSVSEVDWEQSDPERGDQSPKAATLWGDRNGLARAAFLLKPVDEFSSPPHIHTADYHGVVISGAIHDGEPSAKDLAPGCWPAHPRSLERRPFALGSNGQLFHPNRLSSLVALPGEPVGDMPGEAG